MALDPPTDQLSPEDIAELGADHLEEEPLEDDGSFPSSLCGEPVTTATPLGRAILDHAEKYLRIPLREDGGVNQDPQGYIRTFFIEGIPWGAQTWDRYIEKFPSSPVVKPEWCAAFASYCVRKAHESLNQSVPAKLNASTSSLVRNFEAADLFLRRDKLFDEEGAIRADAAVLPHPGDLVSFGGHTALLREIYDDGSFVTVEGNTYRGTPRKDGVYQCNRNSREKKADGTFKLVGFCLLSAKANEQPTSSPNQSQTLAPLTNQSQTPSTAKVQGQRPAAPAPSDSNPGFGKGDKGHEVKQLQEQLNAWLKGSHAIGRAALTCDGVFGQRTESMLLAYQKMEMLLDVPTGRANEATLRSLAEKVAGGKTIPG